MNRETRLGTLAAILGNGIFGFSFMFSRIALDVAEPFVMLMHRFIIAFAMLNIVVACTSRMGRTEDAEGVHWLRFRLRRKGLLPLICMGLIQPVAYFLCESYGISLTNSTVAGVIIAMAPVAALAAGAFALHEIPSRRQIVFSLVSIAGVALMTLQQQSEGEIRLAGILLLLGAVAAGTAYGVVSRRLSGEYSAMERTYVMMGVAATAFTLLALVQCMQNPFLLIAPLHSGRFLMSMLYLGVVSSIVAFMALNYAAGCLPVAKSMAFCNLTTVISLFAGVIFLHEPFGIASLVASALIVIGIWGVQRV